jgi:hypothetical protein
MLSKDRKCIWIEIILSLTHFIRNKSHAIKYQSYEFLTSNKRLYIKIFCNYSEVNVIKLSKKLPPNPSWIPAKSMRE